MFGQYIEVLTHREKEYLPRVCALGFESIHLPEQRPPITWLIHAQYTVHTPQGLAHMEVWPIQHVSFLACSPREISIAAVTSPSALQRGKLHIHVRQGEEGQTSLLLDCSQELIGTNRKSYLLQKRRDYGRRQWVQMTYSCES